MEYKQALTFDDVALVPQYNNIESRTEPDLSSWLTSKTMVAMPIIPSNMDTVIGEELARIHCSYGGNPIFHRFTTLEKKKDWIQKFGILMYLSIGIKDNAVTELRELFGKDASVIFGEAAPIKGICIDVAHGHSKKMFSMIEKLKKEFPTLEIIAGNVCTAMAYHDLVNAGADAIKVGIGPGAACTTRMVTGFGVPQFTAIRDCAEVAERLRVPLIADGGIRNSRDVVLALAAGASTVMIGKLFALTNESAAAKTWTSKTEGIAAYRGQASEDFQKEFYGGLKDKTVAEGDSFWAPVSGPAKDLYEKLLGGLRSGMTYGGARTIKELQRKAEFVRVTSTYMAESNTRPK